MKNIVILGGGSAGWITALLTHAYYPNLKITVIESEAIGIAGVGESTTPSFIEFLNKVNIPVSEMVKHCKATIKHAINFENWNGDKKKYSHSFTSYGPLDEWHGFLTTSHIAQNLEVDELDFARKATHDKKVAFSFRNTIENKMDRMQSFDCHSSYALHIDARLAAIYFSKVGVARGINRVDGELKSVATDEHGNIKQIQLKNGQDVDCDFVFDCSGLARILIGKFFKSEWISYKKYLPMNTALPFFIEHDGNIEPQTDAIAMKYGWVWRIPVEGRYGCGYVFDSNYTNEEDAFKEVQEYFGSKLTYVKTFKFDAGTYKETSIKNCMAVGLAQSFIEPLEATSIYVTYLNINDFLSSDGIFVKSESFRKKFNERCVTRNNNVRNFVFLHYMSQRNDSDFWKEFRQKHPVIDEVQQTLDLINENEYARIDNDCFSNLSWMQVASGLKLLDSNKFKEKMARLDSESIENYKQSFLTNQENILKTCVSHKDFLDYLRQN